MGATAPSPPETAKATERAVVERAKAGDHEAFRILVERYQDRIYRLALRVMRDEEEARDVVQDAFLRVYRSLDKFEGRSSFYTWMYRLTMNLCLDKKRRDKSSRHVEWSEESSQEAAAALSENAGATRHEVVGPVERLERKELRELVARAVESLPEDARRTFLLREVDGLRYAEIARSLGIPKGTVMSRLHYARRRIRAELEAAGLFGSAGLTPIATKESGA